MCNRAKIEKNHTCNGESLKILEQKRKVIKNLTEKDHSKVPNRKKNHKGSTGSEKIEAFNFALRSITDRLGQTICEFNFAFASL